MKPKSTNHANRENHSPTNFITPLPAPLSTHPTSSSDAKPPTEPPLVQWLAQP